MTSSFDRVAARARCDAATEGPWVRGVRQTVAGVMPERFGDGKCNACARFGPPTWAGRRDINGTRMLAHVHTAAEPWYEPGIYATRADGDLSVVYDTEEYGLMDPVDAEFIAHARTDLVAALDALDRVLALCDEAEADSEARTATGHHAVLTDRVRAAVAGSPQNGEPRNG